MSRNIVFENVFGHRLSLRSTSARSSSTSRTIKYRIQDAWGSITTARVYIVRRMRGDKVLGVECDCCPMQDIAKCCHEVFALRIARRSMRSPK